jgi:hypothetical protein
VVDIVDAARRGFKEDVKGAIQANVAPCQRQIAAQEATDPEIIEMCRTGRIKEDPANDPHVAYEPDRTLDAFPEEDNSRGIHSTHTSSSYVAMAMNPRRNDRGPVPSLGSSYYDPRPMNGKK